MIVTQITKKVAFIVTNIYEILSDLGISRKYRGRNYLATGVQLTMHDANYFFHVTKCLYPDVAARHSTNWKCVERDMRTAIEVCWTKRRAQLEALVGHPIDERPAPIDFIDIIVNYLQKEAHPQANKR